MLSFSLLQPALTRVVLVVLLCLGLFVQCNFAAIGECCEAGTVTDAWKLHQCIRQQGGPHVETDSTGTMASVHIVSYATESIMEYAAYAFAINRAYAEHRGYSFQGITNANGSNCYDQHDSRWNKVKILADHLAVVDSSDDSTAKNDTYILWLDADAVIMNFDMDLMALAAQYPLGHIFISAEHVGSSTLVNTGAMLVRKTKWTSKFFDEWWSQGDRRLFSDQEQFDSLYQNISSKSLRKKRILSERVIILPPDALNSDPPASAKQQAHNSVLHLMGEHTPYRSRVFRNGVAEICKTLAKQSAISKTLTFPRQLGLHRSNLLQWSVEEYATESKVLLGEYQSLLEATKSLVFKHDVESSSLEPISCNLAETRAVANAVHHYAHSILQQNRSTENIRTAYEARSTVYDLLRQNINILMPYNTAYLEKKGRALEDWPEMLKMVVQAGQQMLSFSAPDEQRIQLAGEIRSILDEILMNCHPMQRPAVQFMIMQSHSEMGMIYVDSKNISLAIKEFSRGYSIAQELSVISGRHVLRSPASQLANVFAMSRDFAKAFVLYEEAIAAHPAVSKVSPQKNAFDKDMDVDSDSDDIHKDGELDDAIINIHLNYASALSDAGMAFAAKSILENMLGKIKRANMAYTSTAPAVKGHEECSQDDEEPKLKQLENLRDHVLIRIKKMDH